MAINFPPCYRLVELAEIDSTNTECLRAARRGEDGGLWIVARRQSAGRGSRGRSWTSAEGNLFCSLLLDDPAPPPLLSQLTFVASLAARDAIVELADCQAIEIALGLKWPNDLLIAGRKVGGILLESHDIAGRRIVIVGVGVNCVHYPVETRWPATCLAEAGVLTTAPLLLEKMAAWFQHWLAIWDRGRNFARIREAWLCSAVGVGKRIAVRMPSEQLTGVFQSLDDDGRLLLGGDDGLQRSISTAEIFFQG
jgi:BirA family transcriptional regulator, biotin operon repressor / biotin---[acetyl-CoA-carboxylase] ligase